MLEYKFDSPTIQGIKTVEQIYVYRDNICIGYFCYINGENITMDDGIRYFQKNYLLYECAYFGNISQYISQGEMFYFHNDYDITKLVSKNSDILTDSNLRKILI